MLKFEKQVSKKQQEVEKQITTVEHMFRMCIYGALVTLIGGIILGACAVAMVI